MKQRDISSVANEDQNRGSASAPSNSRVQHAARSVVVDSAEQYIDDIIIKSGYD